MSLPYLGQQVWIRLSGNYVRNNKPRIVEGVVTRVGAKYFYCNAPSLFQSSKFSLVTWSSVNDSNFYATAYSSKQEIENIEEARHLRSEIALNAHNPEITLEQLRSAANALNIIEGGAA